MSSVRDSLLRFSGQYGMALDASGNVISDVVEVSATIELNRIEVPLVGQTKQGYKAGRESREGSLNFQKIDSRWERMLHDFLVKRQDWLNNAEGAQAVKSPQFKLKISYRDPDAAGKETWVLNGCQVWRVPLGFNITDDIVNRELPFTWESETPESTFRIASIDTDGNPTPVGYGARPGDSIWTPDSGAN